MSSFGDDPIKDLGFVVFPASAGLDQRDCLFCAFSLHLSCSGTGLSSRFLNWNMLGRKNMIPFPK